VVIRAGVMALPDLAEAAGRTFDLYGIYGISVELAIGVSVLEACRASRRLARYPRLRLSSVGRVRGAGCAVRGAGFALVATFEHPHFTLVLPDISELTLARLEPCFECPIPNPARWPSG
jgi:hypothetical protein